MKQLLKTYSDQKLASEMIASKVRKLFLLLIRLVFNNLFIRQFNVIFL